MRLLFSKGAWAVLFSAVAAGILIGSNKSDAIADRIAELIRELGDDRYVKREAASRQLEAIGEDALPALEKAAADHEDPEIQRRADLAIRAILAKCKKSSFTGMGMVVVGSGDFMMGSPRTEPGRRPDEAQHRVRITRSFVLGKHEVTQDEFQQVMKFNPSECKGKGGGRKKIGRGGTGEFPVENVTWYDAIEFCNRLSKLDGYDPYYRMTEVRRDGDSITQARVVIIGGNGYRLPSEAEWEFACRAGTTTAYHFGNDTRAGLINCKPTRVAGGYGGAVPKWPELGRPEKVGSFPENNLGLHDMHGNVAEWCWDWYDKDYYGRSPRNDPQGPDKGTHRVLRGGSWMVGEGNCRSASRYFLVPSERKDHAGFRVARTPGPRLG